MAAYLTSDWLEQPGDPAAEALASADPTAVVKVGRIVPGAPDGEVRFTSVIEGGVVTYAPGVGDDVDVTLTDTYANAQAILAGELDPNAAFMRGHTKVTGPTSTLLALIAATTSDAYEQARADLAARSAG